MQGLVVAALELDVTVKHLEQRQFMDNGYVYCQHFYLPYNAYPQQENYELKNLAVLVEDYCVQSSVALFTYMQFSVQNLTVIGKISLLKVKPTPKLLFEPQYNFGLLFARICCINCNYNIVNTVINCTIDADYKQAYNSNIALLAAEINDTSRIVVKEVAIALQGGIEETRNFGIVARMYNSTLQLLSAEIVTRSMLEVRNVTSVGAIVGAEMLSELELTGTNISVEMMVESVQNCGAVIGHSGQDFWLKIEACCLDFVARLKDVGETGIVGSLRKLPEFIAGNNINNVLFIDMEGQPYSEDKNLFANCLNSFKCQYKQLRDY